MALCNCILFCTYTLIFGIRNLLPRNRKPKNRQSVPKKEGKQPNSEIMTNQYPKQEYGTPLSLSGVRGFNLRKDTDSGLFSP